MTRNALILGYSVTAEQPGFVEIAAKSPEAAKFNIEKIGLGGFQPSSAVHVFVTEIGKRHPEIVILEQSTPAFRLYSPDQKEYEIWVRAILQACHAIGACFCFLELPQRDLDFSQDWVVSLHRELGSKFGVPCVVAPSDPALLRDEVHPNADGRQIFAFSLIEALSSARAISATAADFENVPYYSYSHVMNHTAEHFPSIMPYERGGFSAQMVSIPAGERLSISFDKPIHIAGYIGLCGPRTGTMKVCVNDQTRRITMYDRHSYYSRAAAYILYYHDNAQKENCRSITFCQDPDIPQTTLLKGEADLSPRQGAVSHLLLKSVPQTMKGQDKMIPGPRYGNNILARGFLLFKNSPDLSQAFTEGEFSDILRAWDKTFFGPCQVWVDPRLNYATSRDNRFGVSVMGLCINPFDGSDNNGIIAENLFQALSVSETSFLDYVDQLSGSFIILYRVNAQVRLLQDCAATKPVYFTRHALHGTIVSSHSGLIGQTLSMPKDPRVEQVFRNELYKVDPSRYLPGDITPFSGMKSLGPNTALVFDTGTAERFFPRGLLLERPADMALVEEVAGIFQRQAEILAATGRPLMVAATAGRDSRVSVAAFSHFPNTTLFSFHFPRTGHLSEDVEVSRTLADIIGTQLKVYDLSAYSDADFNVAFRMTSPVGIWPAAALCYVREFPADAIHIRSTVSEIGRMFYGRRGASRVSAEALARSYTSTDFGTSDLVIQAMKGFIEHADFHENRFFNYSLYDMFYWEHRNSKWQNILCQEAEMATDVFIPYNNRCLIKLLLSVPEADRKAAKIHIEAVKRIYPELSTIPYIS